MDSSKVEITDSHRSGAGASLLSPRERRERLDAVNFARASMNLSGGVVSAQIEQLCKEFVIGRITLADFVASAGILGEAALSRTRLPAR